MSGRKRKKQARLRLWRSLCVMVGSAPSDVRCLHDTAYECLAQDRHERRVLGKAPWWHQMERAVLMSKILQNQPPALWMGDGAQYHQRYRNRRKRR